MFWRDTDSLVVPLDDLISPFQTVTYKSDARQAKPAASVCDLLSLTVHASIAVKIKTKAFVVIIGKQCLNLLPDLLSQEPRRKEEKPSFECLPFVLHRVQPSGHFSLIHWVTFIECSLNGYPAHVRIDLGASDV